MRALGLFVALMLVAGSQAMASASGAAASLGYSAAPPIPYGQPEVRPLPVQKPSVKKAQKKRRY